jgi:hypothetical protein
MLKKPFGLSFRGVRHSLVADDDPSPEGFGSQDDESRTALEMPVIPSEARNPALVRKQCEIPRLARNDKV